MSYEPMLGEIVIGRPNGWGFIVQPAEDLMWIWIFRDGPAGRTVFPIDACAVIPADCGEGRPAFEIQLDDPFVQVFADEDGGYIRVYMDNYNVLIEKAADYPGTTKEENE